MTELQQIIAALEKANMQLTSLGANNTNYCTDAIKLVRKLGEWQDIETAPKDQAILITSNNNWFAKGFWGEAPPTEDVNQCWVKAGEEYRVYPTHWMPLPQPPQEEKLMLDNQESKELEEKGGLSDKYSKWLGESVDKRFFDDGGVIVEIAEENYINNVFFTKELFERVESLTEQLTTTQQSLEAMEALWKDEIQVTRREQDRHKVTQKALESAVEALKFYADEENYKNRSEPFWDKSTAPPALRYPLGYPSNDISNDNGKKAEAALSTIRDKE